jgi:amino acid adenylation domain-containing protein
MTTSIYTEEGVFVVPQIQGIRLAVQQRILWEQQQQGGSFTATVAISLTGRLDAPHLKLSLKQVIERHEILRVSLQGIPGIKTVVQVVGPADLSLWREEDLSQMDPREQAVLVDSLLDQSMHFPFDLFRGPVIRPQLLTLSSAYHLLIITLHALCADNWTLSNLVKEIILAYNDQTPIHSDDEPLQYFQFSEYQNELLREQSAVAEAQQMLASRADAPLPVLPFERKKTVRVGDGAKCLSRVVDSTLAGGIVKTAAALKTSPPVMLMVCWATLLWKLTGEPHQVIWNMFDGRTYEELHSAMGLFAKPLPVICSFSEHALFADMAEQIKHRLAEIRQRQDLLICEPDLQADAATRSLPIGFEYETWLPSHQVKNVHFSIIRQSSHAFPFKLKLSCVEVDQGFKIITSYDPALYSAEAVACLTEEYLTLLRSVVQNPRADVADLNILNEGEKSRLIYKLNETLADYPQDSCVHKLFEQQAGETPDAIAVRCQDQQLTYGELNRQANQLAEYLRQAGVGPEVKVGLCIERSIQMMISLLGILKAEGAYVSLDSSYPQSRLAMILEDAGIEILITRQRESRALPTSEARVILLDQEWAVISQFPDLNQPSKASSRNLAYVIYTSGSTGKPKGVMVEHEGLVNYLHWCIESYGIGRIGRSIVHSPLSFDLTVTSLLPSLLTGRCVELAEESIGAEGLIQALKRDSSPSLIKLTPSHLKILNRSLDDTSMKSAAVIIVGGEALPAEDVSYWLDKSPKTLVINEYGPTETTVGCSVYSSCEIEAEAGTLPIGAPIQNARIYILDSRLESVAAGITGEINIGGVGVARGYLNRPDLTAERFLADPYSTKSGARMYRSGDLGRCLENGTLEYLGRTDNQVKVRGYRIELGEIEHELRGCEEVEESVVVVKEDGGGNRRLVAYVVSKKPVNERELKARLRKRLPEFMMPQAYVRMERLPLTTNGKIDRRALPEPKLESISGQAPRTLVEELVAGIWEDLLKRERVGAKDDFFELGGHSLLAAQMISRVRNVLNVDVPVREVFERPTVEGLAEAIEKGRVSASRAESPPISAVSREQELPLSFAQQRLWFIHQLEPGSSAYNTPRAMRLRGALDICALSQSMREVVRRHEVLRTRFELKGAWPVQIVDEPDEIQLPIWDLSEVVKQEREERAREIARNEAQRPFDLERGPVWRAALVRLEAEEHLLLFCIHHVASDGWSTGLMVREVSALYDAYRNDTRSSLPELAVQYADYAVWQRGWLQGPALDERLAYWKRQLEGAPAVLELPTDHPRPAKLSHHGAMLTVNLSTDIIEQLKQLSRHEGVTLFMTLLAAWKVLLMSYSKQQDIVVGTNVAGRDRAELEGLIGFFVNTLVLRTDLSGDPTFRELLSRVRRVCLDAYAHQDVPFEKLVDELNPKRRLNYHPLYQVKLDFQNMPEENIRFSGLDLIRVEDKAVVSRYDLALTVVEKERSLVGHWVYNPSLFNASTIENMASQFESLLKSIAAQPEARIGGLNLLTEVERERHAAEEARRAEKNSKKFRSIKPKGIKMLQEALLKQSHLSEGQMLPLLAEPAIEGLDLIAWAESNKDFINVQLDKHGALLFRNFNIQDTSQFEQFVKIVSGELLEYKDRSSPRSQIAGNVYSSTDYPADRAIFLHNENSYSHTWPMKLFFYCMTSADKGGETPIADSRRIYTRVSQKIRERFAEKRVMYVRNFGDGFGLSWQTVFQTTDKSVVEQFCRSCGIETQWKANDRLRTRQVQLAIARHPRTNEMVWFNHITFFHISSLDAPTRETLLAELGEEDLPYNTYYGDGSEIESSVLDEIRDAYRQETVLFPWQPTDILMIDNMLTAHGRTAYEGPRKIAVAMSEAFTINDLQAIK